MSDKTYLVCTNEADGNFIFNGHEFAYTSRDFWSDGSTTMHLTDGSQFTWPGSTDPFMRASPPQRDVWISVRHDLGLIPGSKN